VLVALGCPAQERRIQEYYHAAPGAIWIGVGGTLDFFGGRRRRAPGWVQALGLEWLFRLGQEPRRLWRRYLLRDLPALVQLLAWCARNGPAVRPQPHELAFNATSTAPTDSDARRNATMPPAADADGRHERPRASHHPTSTAAPATTRAAALTREA
jgi:hypothetical protein